MADIIRFTATRLANAGKQGVHKPDADGYYELILGGLNVFNSAGQYYTLKGAKSLFEDSHIFMRRIKNGCVKGEVGHPKKQIGMTDQQYLNRILIIEETNVCCHIKDVWLDTSYGINNPALGNAQAVAIMGKVKPAGPQAAALEAALQNPNENVCFSIRALTADYVERGRVYRELNTIVCWDWVTEPGISIANQWNAPALESLTEHTVTLNQLETLVKHGNQSPVALESAKMAFDALTQIKHAQAHRVPTYANW